MTTDTQSQLLSIMQARKSVRAYDPNFKISNEEIEQLIQNATTAPSSSNLQPWRFIVFQDNDLKKELRLIANNQEQVETASAVIAVLGDVEMYSKVEQIYSQNVAEGFIDDASKERMITSTNKFYPAMSLQTREKIATFDAGLITMQLTLLAKEKGYDTVIMGGFDKQKFAERFELPSQLIPIVLISLGKAAAPARGSSRLPIQDIITFK